MNFHFPSLTHRLDFSDGKNQQHYFRTQILFSMTPDQAPSQQNALRRLWRWAFLGATGGTIAIGGFAWGFTAYKNMPDPVTLARLAFVEPSQRGTLFASREIPPSSYPRPFQENFRPWIKTVPWKGQQVSVQQFLDTTRTNAIVVVNEGVITQEWYRDGMGPNTLFPSWSLAKSIVSLMVGQAIGRGLLHEDDRPEALLPNLQKAGIDPRITVRNLLDMTSGLAIPENYNPWRPFRGTAGMYLTHDLGAYIRAHHSLAFTPGSKGVYRSVDTEILGLILSRVEHLTLSEILSKGIWDPIGAKRAAYWNLDHPGGREKAFCCINAAARDFAKIGQLVLDRGRVGNKQIVPEFWIERLYKPAPARVDGLEYSAQWWHTESDINDISAIGVYGQYIYIDPVSRSVVVKLSDYGAEQDEAETLDVLNILAAAAKN
ncbi:Beta-lactamase family protein [Granulibacter bethesdensis]|nr:Beta-lactamase family protein [Granulibacter bethesdensis]